MRTVSFWKFASLHMCYYIRSIHIVRDLFLKSIRTAIVGSLHSFISMHIFCIVYADVSREEERPSRRPDTLWGLKAKPRSRR